MTNAAAEPKKVLIPRTWLIKEREKRGMDRQEFGNACGCSAKLIEFLELGTPTHPQIAAAIARYLGGDVEKYNDLVAECHKARVIPKIKKITEASNTWYSRMFGGGSKK